MNRHHFHRFRITLLLVWVLGTVAAAAASAGNENPTAHAVPLPGVNALPLGGCNPEEFGKLLTEIPGGCEQPADQKTEADCLLARGLQHMMAGAFREATREFEKSLAIRKTRGDHLGRIWLHLFLAAAEQGQFHHAAASAHCEQALAVLGELKRSTEPLKLDSFALFGGISGIPAGLFEQLDQLGPMAELLKSMLLPMMEAMVRNTYGSLLIVQGKLVEAESQLQQALALSRSVGGFMDGPVLYMLGQLRERQGRLAEAQEYYNQARTSSFDPQQWMSR